MYRHIGLSLLLSFPFIGQAQLTYTLDSTTLSIDVVIDKDRVDIPWEILWGPDDKLWMTDGPRVLTWDPNTDVIDTLLERPYGNGLGMTLHPNFPITPLLFVVFDTGHYYANSAQCELMRFEFDPIQQRFINDTTLLTYFHGGEHSGGRLVFDTTGNLLLTTADYWPVLDSLGFNQGKILRIAIDGSVPSDNPTADYTWTRDHRNPQGMCILPNGSIVVSEHGQSANNEINLLVPGENYGWPVWDGTTCTELYLDSCTSPTYENHLALTTFDEPPSGIEFYSHATIPEFTNKLLTGILWYTGMKIFEVNSSYDAITSQSYHSGGLWAEMSRIRDIAIRPDGSFYLITNDREESRIRHVYKQAISNINESPNQNWKIWPNPAKDIVHLSTAKTNTELEITLLDIHGRSIAFDYSQYNEETLLNLPSFLPNGLYFIRLTQNGRSYIEKVMVSR